MQLSSFGRVKLLSNNAINAMKWKILYSCLLITGTFWLAYALGYQHGYQRGGDEERQAWIPVSPGRAGEQVTWHRKAQYFPQHSHQLPSVNAGPDSVTVR
jgi:hypothetical protein